MPQLPTWRTRPERARQHLPICSRRNPAAEPAGPFQVASGSTTGERWLTRCPGRFAYRTAAANFKTGSSRRRDTGSYSESSGPGLLCSAGLPRCRDTSILSIEQTAHASLHPAPLAETRRGGSIQIGKPKDPSGRRYQSSCRYERRGETSRAAHPSSSLAEL
jgi:hypothetical protein